MPTLLLALLAVRLSCSADPAYRLLDFWLGAWEVHTPDGRLDGTNRIEKILGGCAIVENWKDADGTEGKSLFYYDPVALVWKQVWVTDQGPIKEKALVTRLPAGGVIFEGSVASTSDGSRYLDRTTLTPEPGGTVRQVIEASRDQGRSWTVVFDGRYTRPAAKP